jgi:hypothetical protein
MRVRVSPKARVALEMASRDSEAAIEAWEAFGLGPDDKAPTRVDLLSQRPAADALARWAGFRLEVAADGARYDDPGTVGEACTFATLWLRLLAAGAEDRVADGSTLGMAKQYAQLTWRSIGGAGQSQVNRSIRERR